LIDADVTTRAWLTFGLRELGSQVRTAESLHGGLEVIEAARPTGIVTEQVLPDGCVLPELRKLRALAPAAPILIATRYASVASAVFALRNGAAGYLAKPADAREVAIELGLASPAVTQGSSFSVMTLDQIEWEHINRVVMNCGGNVSEAARRLRMHRRSLQRKLARGGPPTQSWVRQGVAPDSPSLTTTTHG
jgi:two-component system response regulator RegA